MSADTNLKAPTDAETVVSLKPDPPTLCWFLAATEQPRIGSATSSAAGTTSLLGVTTVKGR